MYCQNYGYLIRMFYVPTRFQKKQNEWKKGKVPWHVGCEGLFFGNQIAEGTEVISKEIGLTAATSLRHQLQEYCWWIHKDNFLVGAAMLIIGVTTSLNTYCGEALLQQKKKENFTVKVAVVVALFCSYHCIERNIIERTMIWYVCLHVVLI